MAISITNSSDIVAKDISVIDTDKVIALKELFVNQNYMRLNIVLGCQSKH